MPSFVNNLTQKDLPLDRVLVKARLLPWLTFAHVIGSSKQLEMSSSPFGSPSNVAYYYTERKNMKKTTTVENLIRKLPDNLRYTRATRQ